MTEFNAYAAMEAGGTLKPFSYDPGPIGPHEIEIKVTSCGLCHSDLSMINNDWRGSQYPLVPGHEIVGTVAAIGPHVTSLNIGQTVGVGWSKESCGQCGQCLSGSQQRCPKITTTIAGHGGFADRVRVQDIWAIPLPGDMDARAAGPLFCGGITVFAPMMDFGLSPTARVGVVGIGGLGHLALQFARAWGCEVTAFTSSTDKMDELSGLGAHHVVSSRDKEALKPLRGHFDMIISTVNVSLNWRAYLSTLAPEGKFVTVGMVDEPMGIPAGSLITGQKSVAGSDTGAPHMMAKMLEFCARHDIAPMVDYFKMEDVNNAITHLKDGKARYRVVLET